MENYLNLFAICMLMTLYACKLTNGRKEVELWIMDPITHIPQWLETVVDAALPSDSLNVWIPTNNLSTSSLIKVPRFPSVRCLDDLGPSAFDIQTVDATTTHILSGVRNELHSFQVAVAAKKVLKIMNYCK